MRFSDRLWGGVIEEIIKILLLDGRCSMSGATWFVAILFEINILCYLIEWGPIKFLERNINIPLHFVQSLQLCCCVMDIYLCDLE